MEMISLKRSSGTGGEEPMLHIEKKVKLNGHEVTDADILTANSLSELANTAKISAESANTGIDVEVASNTTIDSKLARVLNTVDMPTNHYHYLTEKCDICEQYVINSDLIHYQGHPKDAVEEYIALTHEKLLVISKDADGDIMERPRANITGFAIYDQNGHLCPLDLVDNGVRINMSGYLKPICTDFTEIDDKLIPAKDIGPIIDWNVHGLDDGDQNCITLFTEHAEYYLLSPSKQYQPLMDNLYEKIRISKVVVEYVTEYRNRKPSYQDLLEHISWHTIPELNNKEMTEELVLKYAQFLCDEVATTEVGNFEPRISLPCMTELMKLMGIKTVQNNSCAKIQYKLPNRSFGTYNITTSLVTNTLESFVPDQLDKTNNVLVIPRERCGVCEACQTPDCGECSVCHAMAKFGGHGTEAACVRRLCPNMAVAEVAESNVDDDGDSLHMSDDLSSVEDITNNTIKWTGEPVKIEAAEVYHKKVEIGGSELCNGDFVMLETINPNMPYIVARVVYMWHEINKPDVGYLHGELFIRSADTVLGEVGDPSELFSGDSCCDDTPLTSVVRKACVEKKNTPTDWFNLGGKDVEENTVDDDGEAYFYSKHYDKDTARFEDLPDRPICPNELREHRFCPTCHRMAVKNDIPKLEGKLTEKSSVVPENMTEWSNVKWQDYHYVKDSGVFLKPGTFKLKNSLNDNTAGQKPKVDKVDENIYTEYYRKRPNNGRESNTNMGEPFCVGYIEAVTGIGAGTLIAPQDIYLIVKIMYRPENTNNKFPQYEDLNVVYWSDEILEVPFSEVAGPCDLVYVHNVPDEDKLHEWVDSDPNKFYFRSAYDKASGEVVNAPRHATTVGMKHSVKIKGKGKAKASKPAVALSAEPKVRPLRTLDVFAGCGGLSEGLRRAGVAECRWAIESTGEPSRAYSLNHKNCTVFETSCHIPLRDVLVDIRSHAGKRLPTRGDVELLCGGPPCLGFSGEEEFSSIDYTHFKCSVLACYLSYCDFYRPKYFILESVQNFVALKRGMVLKLTLRALLDMGYQCTFGMLQAGQYGIPQARRRLIVVASAPGYVLPLYPEPTNVFSSEIGGSLAVKIDEKTYETNLKWVASAPRRTCTVRDAISDLPEICNGANILEMDYLSMPHSHFQRMARDKDDSVQLRDHICKDMPPLVMARICRVPTVPDSDWRDLPNISVGLSDGTKCKVLMYRHLNCSGALRGVCSCASGAACSPHDQQEDTLIPWCLVHTADTCDNWPGRYGRLSWKGVFDTTVSDPEPLGDQGRVLHPEQPRVVSVRECARAQGFHDTYQFAGTAHHKYRQIGEAVPPPLGEALGREIMKALLASPAHRN